MTLLDYTDSPFARRPRLHHKPSLAGPSSAGFARRNLVGMMGVMMASGGAQPWSNPYVTDGLISMWDGEWNAGGGVHSSTATSWKDLAGTNDLSLQSGASWASDGLVKTSDSLGSYAASCPFDCNSLTISSTSEVVYQTNSFGGTTIIFVLSCGDTINNTGYDKPSLGFYNLEWGLCYYGAAQCFPLNAVKSGIPLAQSCSLGQDSDGYIERFAYLNGDVVTRRTAGGITLGNDNIYVMGNPNRDNYMTGKVMSIRLYNRALTATEIASNYAVDKARFGLT